MKKISINAKEVVKDIRDRQTDELLMQKYGLSPKSLVRLKQKLLAKNFITLEELQNQDRIPSSREKRPPAKQFVSDFRKRPDDFYLMQKYSLGPQLLKKIYVNLVTKGYLSEYEYHCRNVKAPEVEALSSSDPTTIVTIVDQVEDPGSRGEAIGGQDLSPKPTKDQSHSKMEKPAPAMNQAPTAQESQSSAGDTYEEILAEEEFCPNCGARIAQYSENSCHACGIVYSKYKSYRASRNVAIWDTDRGEP